MPVAQNIGLDEAKPKQISDSIEVEIIDKSNIVYLPGLKLEVKDFNNDVWPSATVIDVDAQDVLIRFDDMATGPNEWISMDSSRLKMTTQPPDEQKPSRCELFGHEKNSKDTKQKSETVVKEELQETETSSQNADVIQTPEPAKVDVKTETQTLAETPVNPIDSSILIGSLRVETEDGAFKCPKEGCKKLARKEHLLTMHIKHYHQEFIQYLGVTPNVADLAYARTAGKPVKDVVAKKSRKQTLTPNHVKLRTSSCDKEKIPKAESEIQTKIEIKAERGNSNHEDSLSEISNLNNCTASPETLFDMRKKDEKARTGIKVLLPVRNSLSVVHNEPENSLPTNAEPEICLPSNPREMKKKLTSESSAAPKSKKQRQFSEIDNSFSLSDDSVCDRDNTLDSSNKPSLLNSSELANSSASDTIPPAVGDTILENGELIKIEKLSEEERIKCTYGSMEEDGLVVECDLCRYRQHGVCIKIKGKQDVPKKYICDFCHEKRQRTSKKKYFHDQDWLDKGTLPKFNAVHINTEKDQKRSAMLKRAFDVMKMVLETNGVLHSLRVKINIAQNKDHPKLYLWAKSWSKIEIPSYPNEPVPFLEKIKDENDNNDDSNIDIKIPSNESMPVPLLKTIKDKNDNNENAKIDLIKILGDDENEISLTSSMNLGLNGSSQSSIVCTPLKPFAPEPEAPIVSEECKSRLLEHIENLQEWVDSTLNFFEVHIKDLEEEFKWSPDTKDQDMHTIQTLLMVLRDLKNIRNYLV